MLFSYEGKPQLENEERFGRRRLPAHMREDDNRPLRLIISHNNTERAFSSPPSSPQPQVHHASSSEAFSPPDRFMGSGTLLENLQLFLTSIPHPNPMESSFPRMVEKIEFLPPLTPPRKDSSMGKHPGCNSARLEKLRLFRTGGISGERQPITTHLITPAPILFPSGCLR
ncbi:unnamed protein product [Lota lota]